MMREISELVQAYQATGEKLSSQQDFGILNELLIRALTPISQTSSAYNEWLSEVISISIMSRRKQNDELVQACFDNIAGIASPRDVVEAGIDRDLIFRFLRQTTELGVKLEVCQTEQHRRRANYIDTRNLEILASLKSQLGELPLIPIALKTAKYWYELALAHKESIIRHYMRLLFKVSSTASHASGGRIELDSAFGDAYLAADTAANRFRPDYGVFASYMGSYLKGGIRVTSSHALGLAAPGARVHSADALQADSIDDNLELLDETSGDYPEDLVAKLDVVSGDPDIRAVLMLSGVTPPALSKLALSK